MSPPRRRGGHAPAPAPASAGSGGRGASGSGSRGASGALGRRDLKALLAQIDAMQRRGRPAAGRRSAADAQEIERLRGLLAEAIAGGTGRPRESASRRGATRSAAPRRASTRSAAPRRAATRSAAFDEDAEGAGDEGADDLHDGTFGDDFDDGGDPDPYLTTGEDGTGGWWPRRSWEKFAPTKPIKVDGGLTTRSRRGTIGETWWSQRFLSAVEAVMVGGRSTRGRTYARQGQVLELTIGPGLIEARVQGSRRAPYRVRVAMPAAADDEWERVVSALAAQAGHAARLLAGELPHEVEDVFAAEGVPLFPSSSSRLSTDCTCPDWANPCKHVAAVCYLAAEAFDDDPFALLAWRGKGRDAVLARLRELRGGAPVPDGEPVPAPAAPDLADCVLGFWKAGPELASLRIRPEVGEMPSAILRHLPKGVLEVRGRDVGDLIEPSYGDLARAAERRAFGGGGEGGGPGRTRPGS